MPSFAAPKSPSKLARDAEVAIQMPPAEPFSIEYGRLGAENEQLRAENERLRSENELLRAEKTERLRADHERLGRVGLDTSTPTSESAHASDVRLELSAIATAESVVQGAEPLQREGDREPPPAEVPLHVAIAAEAPLKMAIAAAMEPPKVAIAPAEAPPKVAIAPAEAPPKVAITAAEAPRTVAHSEPREGSREPPPAEVPLRATAPISPAGSSSASRRTWQTVASQYRVRPSSDTHLAANAVKIQAAFRRKQAIHEARKLKVAKYHKEKMARKEGGDEEYRRRRRFLDMHSSQRMELQASSEADRASLKDRAGRQTHRSRGKFSISRSMKNLASLGRSGRIKGLSGEAGAELEEKLGQPAQVQHQKSSLSDLTSICSQLDDEGGVNEALEQGYVRFLRSAWLLAQPEDYVLEKRQTLEAREEAGESPSPLLTPEEGLALVKRADRSAGVLTHGWLTPGHPDPQCSRLAVVRRALQQLSYIEGLFWGTLNCTSCSRTQVC